MNTKETTPEAFSLTEEEEIASILEHLPSDVEIQVEVPSRGKFYGSNFDETKVSVRPMSFEDEKAIITAQNDPSIDGANLLLSRCVQGLDVENLLLMDKLFLILKIRELSYGSEYKVMSLCSKCNAENKLSIELDKLINVNVPDDFTDPQEIDLPKIKKTCKVRMPRVTDEAYLTNPDKTLDQLWRFVPEIGGSKDKGVIAKVIKRLPISDLHTIINAVSNTEYGIQTEVKFICSTCSEHNAIALPITPNFFSPN